VSQLAPRHAAGKSRRQRRLSEALQRIRRDQPARKRWTIEIPGLQLSVERRQAKGLGFTASYTLSRAKDDASALTTILPNAFDAKSFWGISDFDRTHSLVINTQYTLPTFAAQPTIVRSISEIGLGRRHADPIRNAVLRPIRIRLCRYRSRRRRAIVESNGDPTIQHTEFTTSSVWFNKAAFVAPSAGTFGNQPRTRCAIQVRGKQISRSTEFSTRRTAEDGVPLGGIQRLQSSESGRRK
jgi:hypothetical protein